jgi:predicted signal transduction protein with EAL and GGDEF domain
VWNWIVFDGQQCRISASIGTTLSSFYEVARADEMMNDADQALYASKDKGRAQHTVFQPGQHVTNRRRVDGENRRKAISS